MDEEPTRHFIFSHDERSSRVTHASHTFPLPQRARCTNVCVYRASCIHHKTEKRMKNARENRMKNHNLYYAILRTHEQIETANERKHENRKTMESQKQNTLRRGQVYLLIFSLVYYYYYVLFSVSAFGACVRARNYTISGRSTRRRSALSPRLSPRHVKSINR